MSVNDNGVALNTIVSPTVTGGGLKSTACTLWVRCVESNFFKKMIYNVVIRVNSVRVTQNRLTGKTELQTVRRTETWRINHQCKRQSVT